MRTLCRSAVLFFVFLPSLALAQATSLFVHGSPGDFVENGAVEQFDSPTWTYTVHVLGGGSELQISALGPSTDFFNLTLASGGGILAAGPYEAAARIPIGPSPSVDYGAHGHGCNTTRGRFVVLEADFGPGNTLNSFAANFEQWCEGVFAPVYGEIRINSTIPFTKDEVGADATPDPFALVGQNVVKAGSIVDSNTITVYGINTTVPVSITGGSYNITGQPFTFGASTATNRDHIKVRLQAGLVAGETRSATLTVGGQVATFTVTTYAPGMALTGVYYNNPQGGPLGLAASGIFLAPPTEVTASRNSHNGVEFGVEGVADNNFLLDLAAPGDATLAAGTYSGATRYPFQAPTEPGLDFSGNGAGCNTSTDSFMVRDAAYNGDGSVATFAADFTESCSGSTGPLQGEVRYNSTVPFSALASPALAPLLNISTRGNEGPGTGPTHRRLCHPGNDEQDGGDRRDRPVAVRVRRRQPDRQSVTSR